MPNAPRLCRLNLDVPDKRIYSGHLQAGGTGPDGQAIGCTNYYMTLSGRPFFVVAGEFEASRSPCTYWEEELRKMKAGGVNVVTSYLYWIHHEERIGRFDFSGDRDVRRFFQLCGKVGLYAMARIGPFVHSECRNGGLPDWLYGMPFGVRSNDEGYLHYVRRYYGQLGEQLSGLFFKDGGAIISIQLDNEYGSAAAPWDARPGVLERLPRGEDGASHMVKLLELAAEAGMDAPLMTATAWGEAPIVEGRTIPLHSAYPYAAWEKQPQPSHHLLFRDYHAVPDLPRVGYDDPTRYPFCNVEMQGGMQDCYDQRPVVPPACPEALAVVRTGGGSNFLGYYVYHGGTQPLGFGYTNERLHPLRSYDYQAPVGEFGQVRQSYRNLRVLHLFLEAFGETLAPMGPVMPQGHEKITPLDAESPRFCARVKDGRGFLFLNNFQDHAPTRDQQHLAFELAMKGESITLPRRGTLGLPKDAACILPFNMDLDGALLRYATAQPLTLLRREELTHYFFFSPEGMDAEYCFDKGTLSGLEAPAAELAQDGRWVFVNPRPGLDGGLAFTSASGRKVHLTTLTRLQAESACRGMAWGAQRVIVSPADVTFADGGVQVQTLEPRVELNVFPAVNAPLAANGQPLQAEAIQGGSRLLLASPSRPVKMDLKDCGGGRYFLRFPADLMAGVSDVFLTIDYEGDTGAAFIEGELIADDFCNGLPWTIGLKRFVPAVLDKGLCLYFRPLRKDVLKCWAPEQAAKVHLEGEQHLLVRSITAAAQYRFLLTRPPE